jgi:exoribonuclease II
MLESGLLPDFSTEVLAELDRLQGPAVDPTEPVREVGELLWASLDNDAPLDLDQLTAAVAIPGDRVKILVAVADVDALVKHGSEIDGHQKVKQRFLVTGHPCGSDVSFIGARINPNEL